MAWCPSREDVIATVHSSDRRKVCLWDLIEARNFSNMNKVGKRVQCEHVIRVYYCKLWYLLSCEKRETRPGPQRGEQCGGLARRAGRRFDPTVPAGSRQPHGEEKQTKTDLPTSKYCPALHQNPFPQRQQAATVTFFSLRYL